MRQLLLMTTPFDISGGGLGLDLAVVMIDGGGLDWETPPA